MTELPPIPMNPEKKEEEKDPIQVDYEKGQEFLQAGDHAQAANMFHNVLLAYEEKGDQNGVANASDKLGDICLEGQDYTNALNHFDRAYTICEEEVDDWSMFSLNKKIAKAKRGLNDYQAAIEIYFELLETYQQFKDPAKVIATLETLAETYVEMGDRDKAADSLRTAAGIHTNFKHSRHAQDLLNRAEAIARGA